MESTISVNKSMNFFFGYVWFRISKVYRKEDKIGITGSGFLAFSQSIILDKVSFYLIEHFAGKEYLLIYTRNLTYISVPFILLMIFINHKLYSHRFNQFNEIYKLESQSKSIIKGYLLILYLLIPMIIIFS
jgi:hypothetical protein